MLTNKNMTRKHVNENMKVMIETEIVAWGKVEE